MAEEPALFEQIPPAGPGVAPLPDEGPLVGNPVLMRANARRGGPALGLYLGLPAAVLVVAALAGYLVIQAHHPAPLLTSVPGPARATLSATQAAQPPPAAAVATAPAPPAPARPRMAAAPASHRERLAEREIRSRRQTHRVLARAATSQAVEASATAAQATPTKPSVRIVIPPRPATQPPVVTPPPQ